MDPPQHSPAEGEPDSSAREIPAPGGTFTAPDANPSETPETRDDAPPRREVTDSLWVMLQKTITLQLVLMIIVSVQVTLKFAANNFPFASWQYACLFFLCFGVLGCYAIVWQKVLKRFSLLEAYSNKAIAGFWFLLLGYFLFGDAISIWNFIGVAIITFGVTRLYARSELPVKSPAET